MNVQRSACPLAELLTADAKTGRRQGFESRPIYDLPALLANAIGSFVELAQSVINLSQSVLDGLLQEKPLALLESFGGIVGHVVAVSDTILYGDGSLIHLLELLSQMSLLFLQQLAQFLLASHNHSLSPSVHYQG